MKKDRVDRVRERAEEILSTAVGAGLTLEEVLAAAAMANAILNRSSGIPLEVFSAATDRIAEIVYNADTPVVN